MPNCLILSGCKIVDLLDAATFVQKTTINERSTKDSFVGQYTYFFRNGWFVALPCPSAKEMDWPQRQRMMHMRLRRLVLAHNDMFLQQAQYERELILRPVPNSRIKKPGNNVYTGYGDVGHIFFYYGVMNDGAFAQKFATDEDNDEEENDEEIDVGAAQEVNPANLPQINSDDDIFYRIPYLGLRMTLDVKCPLSYAPQSFLAKMSDIDLKQLKDNPKTSRKVETRIRVIFQCEGASYPRLPTMYDYDFRPVATTAK
ncbi:unnamed protein product [Callosobruchus maculatus]|uniref:Uncharacterized protein n=1 Tax=Callosobruchus maculatus TaxID=64391 RepID=A0A653DCS8_CALMS|nr:unnamed protein product [Callosobruchus maculatus]